MRESDSKQKAGVLLDASGLHPSSKGWRIRWSGGAKTVVDGPFAEAKELVAGYTLIQVELDDFEQGPAVDRFREMELPAQAES